MDGTTISVEAFMCNPPKPISMAVRVNGVIVASFSADEVRAALSKFEAMATARDSFVAKR